ncbi:MFS general substrate transporter [Lentinus brumalis]|uniref:MFS general substrate transporter n=1 Tax=Lentinus brumalis TaxID=2498619 RepID=A0A371CVK8_9APHY|nr:MFS general substrate transporter [Polyporus brumalis]
MVFGILEDYYLENVPGTGLLSDHGVVRGQEVEIDVARDLKRGTGRYAHIILIPQPSDDPRDPLNWPSWKKEACFWTLSFGTSLTGALSPLVSAGYVLLSKQFNVSVDDVTSSFGILLLGLGIGMVLQNALAVKFGHRIVYLVSSLLMFISCIWCALSPNLASIRASRFFQGCGMSAGQGLVPSTFEQMYYVHERGSRSVIWNFSIMAGITLGPLVCSYVIQNLTWEFGFWFVSIALGIATVMVFLFVPETTFHRAKAIRPTKEQTSDRSSMEKSLSETDIQVVERELDPLALPGYISGLKIWHGTYTNENLLKIFLRQFTFVLSPVAWFVFLTYGMQTVWLSLVPLCSATIFTLEYNFNAAQIGLTNLGGIVGIVLAMLVTGPLNDWGVVWISKRNRGIYEPEFRLIFMISMLFGVSGYVGWAVGNDHHMPWIGAVACITMFNFSMVVSGSAAVTYLLDTHRENALHILAVTNFAKNMVLYGSTFFANGIILNRGVKVSLLILGACQAFCWLASIPMYIFGKRVRSFIARHPEVYRGEAIPNEQVLEKISGS